jgi:hypothetical protein
MKILFIIFCSLLSSLYGQQDTKVERVELILNYNIDEKAFKTACVKLQNKMLQALVLHIPSHSIIKNELYLFKKKMFSDLSELTILTSCVEFSKNDIQQLTVLKSLSKMTLGVGIKKGHLAHLPVFPNLSDVSFYYLNKNFEDDLMRFLHKNKSIKKVGIPDKYKTKNLKSEMKSKGIQLYTADAILPQFREIKKETKRSDEGQRGQ